MIEWLKVIFLGILEGLTEFIPVSSTGHLIVAGHFLQFDTASTAFDVAIQVGAILAIVVVYRQRFAGFISHNPEYRFSGSYACIMLLVTSCPALLLGLLGFTEIKQNFFAPIPVAWAWVLGGIAIILIEQMRFRQDTNSLDEISLKVALGIGLWQCLALCPGVSRSAATIIGGLFLGLDRKTAAEYSFFAAVPILFCAAAYDIYKMGSSMEGFLYLLGGGAMAFLSAILAIRVFLPILSRYSLSAFGYYRIVIGVGVLCYLSLNPYLNG